MSADSQPCSDSNFKNQLNSDNILKHVNKQEICCIITITAGLKSDTLGSLQGGS